MSLSKMLRFITAFNVLSTPRQTLVMQEAEVSSKTFVLWSGFCREVITYWAFTTSTKLGGPGKIVEIDEAKFGRRKYNVGRLIEGQWILGGVERGSKKAFYVPVQKRDAETLIECIQKWVLLGTTIITDCWKAYGSLKDLGYEHFTVNHKKNFVDPETGANTNTMERSWRDAKAVVPRYGKNRKNYEHYLSEVQFRRMYPDPKIRLHQFLKIVASLPEYKAPPMSTDQKTSDDTLIVRRKLILKPQRIST